MNYLISLLVILQINSAFARDVQEVNVAYVGGLSGPGVGAPASAAYKILKLYFEGEAKQNHLKGYKISLKPYDNQFEPSKNLEIFTQLKNDKIDIVTGIHYSNDGLIIVPLLENAEIPTIITTASHPSLVNGRKFIHRVCFSDVDQARVIVDGINKRSRGNIFIIRDVRNTFSVNLTKLVEDIFKIQKPSKQISIIDASRGQIDLQKILPNLDHIKNDDVLFLTTNVPDSALILYELNKKNLHPLIFGTDAWANLEIEEALKSYKLIDTNAYYASHWIFDLQNKDWLYMNKLAKSEKLFVDRFISDPILTYEAGKLIVATLNSITKFNRKLFNEKIRNQSVPGVLGPIRIKGNGESTRVPSLVRISHSKIVGPAY